MALAGHRCDFPLLHALRAWFAKAYQNYQEYSRNARTWTLVTLCVGIGFWVLYFFFYAVLFSKLGDLSELAKF